MGSYIGVRYFQYAIRLISGANNDQFVAF